MTALKTNDSVLKNFTPISGDFKVYGVESYTAKELTDRDCYYLRYCLMRFILNNRNLVYDFVDQEGDYEKIYYKVDESATICNNTLNLNDFEGYQISDNTYLKSLKLSIENRVILNVYNSAADNYAQYLID